ncbi:RNA methyltransferase [Mangrovivirga sp. M17]|uniref:RNA methyltransferase n=1 Tax=Mangrovivirga halotolerans TaxID=2993936 RepID=A0ABT3RL48_9BACT|nr:RNA methyltransferase [Mangrovivirga halotolerans]MCX2742553.1 RNA methyltransferase [Mangrovivirga halotolerans]
MEITSTKNPRIKNLTLLQSKGKARREQGIFIVEGEKENELLFNSDYQLKEAYICPEIINDDLSNLINDRLDKQNIFTVTKEVFNKIAYRGSTGGIITIASQKYFQLDDLKNVSNPLILVAESVEKPGNIGALLRTVDAAKIDALVICDPKTDFFNPNVIRSSLGCVFTTKIISCTSDEAISFFNKEGINIYCAALTASKRYDLIDYRKGSALVFGTESTGLTDLWLNNSTQNIIIPMQGKIDSLNVSVSAAVITFEAVRQRGF